VAPHGATRRTRQRGTCPLCNLALLDVEDEPQNPREWEMWPNPAGKALHAHHLLVYRRHGGSDERSNLRLVHTACHTQRHATRPLGSLQEAECQARSVT